ncbi:MAG: DUF6338 family protein [Mycobacterium sp.]|uniref:DUF6338 family protein n=1 Tax=Mycobacterium sp. TaxID=1785 RepID=UPI003F9C77F7
MTVTGWQQALTVLLVVVPGFVYQGRLARLRGPTPEDRDLLGVRILRALAASAMFGLAYLVVLGPSLTGKVSKPRDYLVAHPRIAAIALAVLVFGVPTRVVAVFLLRILRNPRATGRLHTHSMAIPRGGAVGTSTPEAQLPHRRMWLTVITCRCGDGLLGPECLTVRLRLSTLWIQLRTQLYELRMLSS